MNVFQLKWNKVRNHRVFYQLLKGFLKIISNFGTNYKRKLLASWVYNNICWSTCAV